MEPLVIGLSIFSFAIYGLFNFAFASNLNSEMLDEKPDVFVLICILSFITNITSILYFVSFFRASNTSPGRIPDCPPWNLVSEPDQLRVAESKKSGGRRFCRYERRYKPDRSHHCSQCHQCTLRMDHHCPWLNNCVGFWNYKYFVLTLYYACLSLLLIAASCGWLAHYSVNHTPLLGIHVSRMATGIVLSAVCGILSFIISLFFCIHVLMMLRGVTTLEVFEKNRYIDEEGSCLGSMCCTPKDPITKKPLSAPSIYRLSGVIPNLKASLGDDIIWWLLPTKPRMKTGSADGLTFEVSTPSPLSSPDGEDSPLVQTDS